MSVYLYHVTGNFALGPALNCPSENAPFGSLVLRPPVHLDGPVCVGKSFSLSCPRRDDSFRLPRVVSPYQAAFTML